QHIDKPQRPAAVQLIRVQAVIISQRGRVRNGLAGAEEALAFGPVMAAVGSLCVIKEKRTRPAAADLSGSFLIEDGAEIHAIAKAEIVLLLVEDPLGAPGLGRTADDVALVVYIIGQEYDAPAAAARGDKHSPGVARFGEWKRPRADKALHLIAV